MNHPNRRNCMLGLMAATCLPVSVRAQDGARVVDETWRDRSRARDVPVRVRWPQAGLPVPRPVILFSHGLGGSVDAGTAWGMAWADAGFIVVHMQHPGSDLPAVRAAMSTPDGLRQVASAAQLLARLQDVAFVLDEIGRRHGDAREGWGEARPNRVGMSGHSFGAITTMAMAGLRSPGQQGIREPRLSAFMPFSPSLPASHDTGHAYGAIERPVLSITGTRDEDVIGNGATPDRRIAVFGALPAGGKAHLVLQDADHMTFAGQPGRLLALRRRTPIARDLEPAHHATVARISTDWWRATLADDADARARLRQPAGLRDGDLWQQK